MPWLASFVWERKRKGASNSIRWSLIYTVTSSFHYEFRKSRYHDQLVSLPSRIKIARICYYACVVWLFVATKIMPKPDLSLGNNFRKIRMSCCQFLDVKCPYFPSVFLWKNWRIPYYYYLTAQKLACFLGYYCKMMPFFVFVGLLILFLHFIICLFS